MTKIETTKFYEARVLYYLKDFKRLYTNAEILIKFSTDHKHDFTYSTITDIRILHWCCNLPKVCKNAGILISPTCSAYAMDDVYIACWDQRFNDICRQAKIKV